MRLGDAARAALVLAGLLGRVPPLPARELALEDAPCSVFGRRGPAVLLLGGATPLGRRHPRMISAASALARAGHVVYMPDVYGVAEGVVSGRGVSATVRVARSAGGTVALVGVSVGTTVALLAAAEPDLAGCVSVVAGFAGYADLVDLIRIATTERFESAPFLFQCVDRSLRAGGVGPATGELLANRRPERFAQLYAALSPDVRAAIERLSPAHRAAGLHVPVLILADPGDKYFPPDHLRRLPQARVTWTRLLRHADIGSLRDLRELVPVFAFATRVLRLVRAS